MAEGGDLKTCGLCKSNDAKYQCPRCNIMYCSLPCYKSQAHIKCSEGFYRDCVMNELKSHGLSDEEKKKSISKMQDILKREAEFRAMDEEDLEMLKREDDDDDNDDGECWEELKLPSSSRPSALSQLRGENLKPLTEEDRDSLIPKAREDDFRGADLEEDANPHDSSNKIALCQHEQQEQEQDRIKLDTDEDIILQKALELAREEEDEEVDDELLDQEEMEELLLERRFAGIDIENADPSELYSKLTPSQRRQFRRFIENVSRFGAEIVLEPEDS